MKLNTKYQTWYKYQKITAKKLQISKHTQH